MAVGKGRKPKTEAPKALADLDLLIQLEWAAVLFLLTVVIFKLASL